MKPVIVRIKELRGVRAASIAMTKTSLIVSVDGVCVLRIVGCEKPPTIHSSRNPKIAKFDAGTISKLRTNRWFRRV
jgi:hypothetical protein